MSYPNSIDSFSNPSGTNTLDSPDHAGLHTSVNGAVTAIETAIGTTAATAALKNFAAGDFASRINSAGTLQQVLTGGTLNNVVLGTPQITQINSSGTTVSVTVGESLAPTTIVLSDSVGGTITANAAAGQVQYLTLGTSAGNRTLGTPTNATAGQALLYAVKASGSANGTLVWAGIFRFSQDVGTPAIGTGVTWNYFGWRFNSIDTKWDYQGSSKDIV